jgi:hypothetical protein
MTGYLFSRNSYAWISYLIMTTGDQAQINSAEKALIYRSLRRLVKAFNSVGDPDPQDPHVFRPPGSGSISERYGFKSFPFLIKVLSGLK